MPRRQGGLVLSKTSVDERRAHTRHSTDLTIQGTPDEGGVVARMVARNLSLGGLYCTSTTDFPEMTRLAVRLMLPLHRDNPGETEPVDLEAVVVRREKVNSRSGEPRYRLALFFTSVDDDARKRLAGFVDHTETGPSYH